MSKKKSNDAKEEQENFGSQNQNNTNSSQPLKNERERKQKLREQKKNEEIRLQQEIFGKMQGYDEGFSMRKAKVPIVFSNGRSTSLGELTKIRDILLSEAREYSKTFPPQFYNELRRLTGYNKDKKNPHHKPMIFAIYTIKYVYGRFNLKDLIRELQQKNPFLPGLN